MASQEAATTDHNETSTDKIHSDESSEEQSGTVPAPPAEQKANPAPAPAPQPAAKGWRFWAIFPPLCIATLFSALESTVTSTSLPEITAALNAGPNWTWFLDGYLLTS